MTAKYELRVTRRALDDVGLKSLAGLRFDLQEHKGRHPILEAFAEKRARSPIGQEQTMGIKAPVYNLHARNPWRGVTWHDENAGVCWLLGVTPHDYNEFVARAKAGGLAPTDQDYADLNVARSLVPPARDESQIVQAIAEQGATLVAQAFDHPNTEVVGVLVERLEVTLLLEVVLTVADGADLYIGFKMPPRPGSTTLPDALIQVCVAAMLPDAHEGELDWRVEDFPGRVCEPGEWVVRWRRPEA